MESAYSRICTAEPSWACRYGKARSLRVRPKVCGRSHRPKRLCYFLQQDQTHSSEAGGIGSRQQGAESMGAKSRDAAGASKIKYALRICRPISASQREAVAAVSNEEECDSRPMPTTERCLCFSSLPTLLCSLLSSALLLSRRGVCRPSWMQSCGLICLYPSARLFGLRS